MTTIEFLEQRVRLLEATVVDLGSILVQNLPAAHPAIMALGSIWDERLHALDKAFADSRFADSGAGPVAARGSVTHKSSTATVDQT